MINLDNYITQIEKLLSENTDSSITYAALECRLAIEGICYDRLRQAHDYISHADIVKWSPRDIVNVLIKEVDASISESFTLSISREPSAKTETATTREEFQSMDFLPIGTQVGFNSNKLGKLWNALANLALHMPLPISREDVVNYYGDKEKIKKKVDETLAEIKRIAGGTLVSSGMGEEVSFECYCGANNRRRVELLKNGQRLSCINPDCLESYEYVKENIHFTRRVFGITCRNCGEQRSIPKRFFEKVRTDQHIHFDCEKCAEKIYISWRLMQSQDTEPKAGA